MGPDLTLAVLGVAIGLSEPAMAQSLPCDAFVKAEKR
jgi:hypothetical protein